MTVSMESMRTFVFQDAVDVLDVTVCGENSVGEVLLQGDALCRHRRLELLHQLKYLVILIELRGTSDAYKQASVRRSACGTYLSWRSATRVDSSSQLDMSASSSGSARLDGPGRAASCRG